MRQGAVEQFDHVQHFLPGAMNRGAGAKLQNAAGIGGDDGLRFRRARGFHFQRQQFERRFRLGHVVDAGRAAALVRQRHFHEFHAGNGANQLARRFADFLSVRKMAGILIRDAQRHVAQRRGEPELGEKFRHVAHLRGELHGLRVRGIVGAKRCVYSLSVEPHPAALVTIASKSSLGNAGKFVRARLRATSRTPACAGSAPQQTCPAGTTTSQPLACSTRIVARLSSLKVTCATQPAKSATRARRAPCGGNVFPKLAEEKFAIDFRQQPLAILQSEQPQNSGAARERRQARALIESQQPRGRGDSARVGKQPAIDEIAREARGQRPLIVLLDLRARQSRRACRIRRPKGTPSRTRGNRGSGRCA